MWVWVVVHASETTVFSWQSWILFLRYFISWKPVGKSHLSEKAGNYKTACTFLLGFQSYCIKLTSINFPVMKLEVLGRAAWSQYTVRSELILLPSCLAARNGTCLTCAMWCSCTFYPKNSAQHPGATAVPFKNTGWIWVVPWLWDC